MNKEFEKLVEKFSERTGINKRDIETEVSEIMEERNADIKGAFSIWMSQPRIRSLLRGKVKDVIARVLAVQEPSGNRDWATAWIFVGYDGAYEEVPRRVNIREDAVEEVLPFFEENALLEFKARLGSESRDGLKTCAILSKPKESKEDFPTIEKFLREANAVSLEELDRIVGRTVFVEGVIGSLIQKRDSETISGFVISDPESIQTLTVWKRDAEVEAGQKVKVFGDITISEDFGEAMMFCRSLLVL